MVEQSLHILLRNIFLIFSLKRLQLYCNATYILPALLVEWVQAPLLYTCKVQGLITDSGCVLGFIYLENPKSKSKVVRNLELYPMTSIRAPSITWDDVFGES